MDSYWLRVLKMPIIVGICPIIVCVSVKALYCIGLNMGPPSYRGEALSFLRRNSLEIEDDCFKRLVNLDSLNDDEVLRFMAMENEGIWFLIGENLSVSDDIMIKGYSMLSAEGKENFRAQWRYWGWSQNRVQLACVVWRDAEDRVSQLQQEL